jgi:hypothetical protein
MKTKLYSLLAVVASLLPVTQAQSSPDPSQTKVDMTGVNTASLKSIESSWLEVPRSCKAKGFNAEPITITHQPLRSEVAAIYGLLSA